MQEEKFIVHVTTNLGGGVWSVIKSLINYQISKGYKVGLLYPNYFSSLKKDLLNELNSDVILIPVQTAHIKGATQTLGMPIRKTFIELQKVNKSKKIIFHAHNTAAVGLLRNIQNIPLICTIHGVSTNGSLISKLITFLILKKMRRHKYQITAVSDFVTIYYNRLLKSSSIVTVLNGTDIGNKSQVKTNKKFTIGYVGYIDDLKGWNYILEAYMRLERTYFDNINILLAGSGPEKDIEKLNDFIKIHKLENNVKFLGQVEDAGNTLVPFLDLLILPSQSEGLPMTLIEASGNKIPLLATEVGGIPEILIDGYNGYFIKRSASDIASKIKLLYDNENLYEMMSKNSFKHYNKKFTSEKMNQQYLILYNKGQ